MILPRGGYHARILRGSKAWRDHHADRYVRPRGKLNARGGGTHGRIPVTSPPSLLFRSGSPSDRLKRRNGRRKIRGWMKNRAWTHLSFNYIPQCAVQHKMCSCACYKRGKMCSLTHNVQKSVGERLRNVQLSVKCAVAHGVMCNTTQNVQLHTRRRSCAGVEAVVYAPRMRPRTDMEDYTRRSL